MRLLLLNPNTTAAITARLVRSARRRLLAGDSLTAVTADHGPAVVRSADQLAEAEASALALAARHLPAHDALLLAISLDGAADALRRAWPQRVIVGMTEAALACAGLSALRLGVLTVGPAMRPLYEQRLDALGWTPRVVALEAPELAAAFDTHAADDVQAPVLQALAAAGERLRDAGAEAVVLAGAVLCGYAQPLQGALGMPVFDGVECAVVQARALLELGVRNTLP